MRVTYLFFLLLGLAATSVQGQHVLDPARTSTRPDVPPTAAVTPSLQPFRQGRLWGYRSAATGRVLIRPQYTHAAPFALGLAKVWRGTRCGFIDQSGHVVVPIRFDQAAYELPPALAQDPSYTLQTWPGGRGYVVVVRRDTIATRRLSGEKSPPATLASVPQAWTDTEWIQRPTTHRWGLYDSTGREVLPPQYTGIRRRDDGLLAAARIFMYYNGSETGGDQIFIYDHFPLYKEQLFTAQGRLLLQGQAYTELRAIHLGYLVVYDQYEPFVPGRVALIDTATTIRSAWYDEIQPLGEYGFVAVSEASAPLRYVWLGRPGNPQSAPRYHYLHEAKSGQAIAQVQGADGQLYYGVVALATGAWVIPPYYTLLRYTPTNGYESQQRGQWVQVRE